VGEFLVLPKAFVAYVTAYERIPIPPDTQIETLRSQIELICLEVCLDSERKGLQQPAES
jgi:hypothetical protein